ncbi:MAG TPA: hypothetical protein VHT29_05075 [Solirubrobacteraceae bacterium]|nr:hypothetical protein [Solirubrobacteraceae bacterium]
MADIRFSLAACTLSLLVAILALIQAAWAPAVLFGLLALGFAVRAVQGGCSRR